MEMRDWEPIKDVKRFEGKRPPGKHGLEWEDNIKIVYLLTGETASERTALVYPDVLKGVAVLNAVINFNTKKMKNCGRSSIPLKIANFKNVTK